MSPLLTPPSSDGPEKLHQLTIQVQVILAMGQYRLSKEEAGKFLDQRLHVVTTT